MANSTAPIPEAGRMNSKKETHGGTLVIQPLPGIGDTIWHLPHLRAIADTSADRSITLLTKERSLARDLLAGADHVQEVLYLAPDGGRHSGPLGGWRLGEDLRPHGFGSVWILHGSSRYALAACRAGISKRIGYGIGWQDALLTSPHGLSRRDRSLPSIAKANRLLELHSVSLSDAFPTLPLTDAARQVAETALAALPRPVIALAIGSSEDFKQWGEANFGNLIQGLREQRDYSILLVGGPRDTALAREIVERFQNPPWLVKLIDAPILEAAAAASLCAACIGNDTGMLNAAAAVGTPTLGLFGGSVPLHDDPRITSLSPAGRVRHGTDRMAEISVDMVLESFGRLDLG
jgi:heptosyltransferase II